MADQETLQQVEVDIDDFSGVGSNNILTPITQIFKRNTVDTQALNDFTLTATKGIEFGATIPKGEPETEVKKDEDSDKTLEKKFEVPEDLNEQLENPSALEEEKEKIARAKTEKSSLVDYLKEKIESKEFITYDDYDDKAPLDEYLSKLSKKDLHNLIDDNLKFKEEKVKKETPEQFFESLPYELQVAADYWVNKGGRDLKGLFSALGKVEEIRDLDPTKDTDQEQIVEEYLKNANTDWTSDEVKEQLNEWKDLGQLEKKAKQLKPKLDRMKEQMVAYQLEQQEVVAQQRQVAAQKYQKNVYDALVPGEINGLKLDNKIQSSLYNGLIRADYQSISGGSTNELGHLLEKYQYQEPNYGLISEVLWHLKDPDGYRNALIQKGKNTQTEETVKKLKTEQGNRSSSTAFEEGFSTNTTSAKIPKDAGKNLFKR